jgi:predicted tellurium resistance membrane protein TerC
VLGIDNILVITLAVGRIDSLLRDKARMIGLFMELAMRLAALCGASLLICMSNTKSPLKNGLYMRFIFYDLCVACEHFQNLDKKS